MFFLTSIGLRKAIVAVSMLSLFLIEVGWAQSPSTSSAKPLTIQSNEGFWGHVNPFARKRWVGRQTGPIKDRLNELDEISAKNTADITRLDQQSRAGIHQAQQTADSASRQAADASMTANQAQVLAQQSGNQALQLSNAVANLDRYQAVSETEIRFHPGQLALNAKAKDALDGIAAQLKGQRGYLIEVQGYTRTKGQAGVQNSQRLANSIVRYFVEQHQVPVYRVHVLGMGDAFTQDSDGRMANGSMVHVTLVQNSLAALNLTGNAGGSPIGGTQQFGKEPPARSVALSPSAQQ